MEKSALESGKENVRSLIKDAQDLFNKAASMTGKEAAEIHRQGMALLDSATSNIHNIHEDPISAGKEAVVKSNNYAKNNPWSLSMAGIGLGFVVGMIFAYFLY